MTVRRWAPQAGAALFVGMMALGYYDNVNFVQIGLTDLGRRRLGLAADEVASAGAVRWRRRSRPWRT